MTPKILILGAGGQIGSELTFKLRTLYGEEAVIASDINKNNLEVVNSGPFECINAKDYDGIKDCIIKYNIKKVYLMAAMLSASGEKHPLAAWDLNMTSLFNVLNLAKEGYIESIFWPSSIAVFGHTTPRHNTPQHTIMEPSTVYGISKLSGERWCEYYKEKYNIDVRSLRYPGIISWKTKPGGGTTDYAIDIFHKAILEEHYNCFLSEDTELPMMYMDDAINATIELMQASKDDISVASYNLAAISFTPKEIAATIKDLIPEFSIDYTPDFRQDIADSWPASIDDSLARKDWNWQHQFGLSDITKAMLTNLENHYKLNGV
ncbi:NAD-dependent epimerase/dehydratase family protein [Winogradskyella sp. 3972H.M.0a.05]|uniref:NAD-dependent epimerase/dehydratase family protein n=1 Tax=Winogradskyella sp. 3972H.M.0a.05 TaxID=2950277 RepID=UPI003394268C